jgi:hypothetical protein
LLGAILALSFRIASKVSTEDAAAASPALESIDIGGSLPTLKYGNENGDDIRVANLANEKGVVLSLVSKADTRTLVVFRSLRASC